MKLWFSIFLSALLLNSCALKKPIVVRNVPIGEYQYVFITQTKELTSSAGGTYGNQYGMFGSTVMKTVNPADVIAGMLIKEGFVVLPELKDELLDETLVVNYGESGRRDIWGGLFGYTLEITLQFISARSHEVLCTTTAEGMGSTEADDIRQAIERALSALFDE